jgi:hypothetical protein
MAMEIQQILSPTFSAAGRLAHLAKDDGKCSAPAILSIYRILALQPIAHPDSSLN